MQHKTKRYTPVYVSFCAREKNRLCENCDKFAIQRKLPEIDMGDLIVIHDTGAHGHSMGYNYNGRLRHQEIMVHEDGSVQQIRRNETLFDLFATLDFPSLKENTAKVEK